MDLRTARLSSLPLFTGFSGSTASTQRSASTTAPPQPSAAADQPDASDAETDTRDGSWAGRVVIWFVVLATLIGVGVPLL
ncbi:hypothetical protein WG922_06850 [Ramlibacter sp. AN1015]|uniref:hypothetical protein n=1 Tax=Ramlibacter sp. AN1015 TaxID=3133428 RepID=UPI0030BCF52A